MGNDEVVLDTSAILAVVNEEPGAEVVLPMLDRAIINAVTLAEVITKMADWGIDESTIRDRLDDLGIRIVPFDEDQAYRTGMLRSAIRRFGLSLGDRACLALGLIRELPVVTADRNWVRVSLDLDLQLIR